MTDGPGGAKYIHGKPLRVGQKVLTVEQYNRQAQQLEDAINRTQAKNPANTQLPAQTKKLTGNLLLGTGTDRISVQRVGLAGLSTVKVGLASLEQLGINGAIFANPTTWNMLLDITEGDKGANFPLRTINVPILGCIVATRGDSVYATLRNSSGLADLIEMSLSICEAQQTPSPVRRTRFSNLTIPIPIQATHFTYTINGGVTVGDTIIQRDAAAGALTTLPAREGAFVPINEFATQVSYAIVAGVPRFVEWMFFTEK